MALSKAGLNKALKKYQPMLSAGKSIDEITTELQVDENGYDQDEIQQILKELDPASGTPPPPPPPPPGTGTKGPDELAELASIDYKNLKGEQFKKYVELVGDRSYRTVNDETGEELPVVGKLRQDKSYEFEQYRAVPIFKSRFPGIKDSPMDFIGVELLRDKPEHTTKIPVSVALEFNAQILNQHSRAGHGKYYLLKK